MANTKLLRCAIVLLISVFLLSGLLIAQEKVVRYKRKTQETKIDMYLTIGGEYYVDGEEFYGQAGFILELPFSDTIWLTPEATLVTNDFSSFTINAGAMFNIRLGSGGTVPFFGLGGAIYVPTSKSVSTELRLKGNLGVIIDNLIRITAYYGTPVDHPFEYHTIGLLLGIII